MDPTLTLQLPLILLGRKELKDPDDWSAEERQTRPLQVIHTTLRKFCPNVNVRLGNSDEQFSQEAVWILRPISSDGTRNLDDCQLSIYEKAKLGNNIWSCSMLLQRAGIPLSTRSSAWFSFVEEATRIFAVLTKYIQNCYAPIEGIECLEIGQENKHLRWWSLVTGEQCHLCISLIPDLITAQESALPLDIVKDVLIIFAAVERELTLLSTPASLMEYWSLSRFLEYRAIRQLSQEKVGLWKRLKDKKDWTDKRKRDMYAHEKKKWLSGFGEEDRACERINGRRREWWDVVDGTEIEELLTEITDFKESGRRMGVEVAFGREDKDDDVDETRERHAKSSRTNTSISLTDTLGKQDTSPKNRPVLAVTAITFPSYNSTTNISELLAYTELIASLLNLATQYSHTKLIHLLENHRETTSTFQNDPLRSFDQLMLTLGISHTSKAFWATHLHSLFHPAPQTTHKTNISPNPDLLTEPFHPLHTYIARTLSAQRTYIPTFLARYNTAGGFYPTPTKKVYALMLADEHVRRKGTGLKTVKGNQEWLDREKERVRVEDVNKWEEDVDVRALRTPELSVGERGERAAWVREMLMREG